MKQAAKIKGLADLANLANSVGGADADKEFDSLPIDDIYSKAQPRKVFEGLEQLAESLVSIGQLQPIVVSPDGNGRYIIEQGERRFRAAKIAGMTHLEAVITKPSGKKVDRIIRQLAENAARDDMKLHEVVDAVGEILGYGVRAVDLAKKIGKDKTFISTVSSLVDLPAVLRELMVQRIVQDPASLRRLKKVYEVAPAQVEKKINEWKNSAARSRSEDASEAAEPFVIPRSQVMAFAKALEREQMQAESESVSDKPEVVEPEQTEAAKMSEVDPSEGVSSDGKTYDVEPAVVEPEQHHSQLDAQDRVCNPGDFRVYVEVEPEQGSGYIEPGVVPADGKVSVVYESGMSERVDPSRLRIIRVGVDKK